jgi:hypothetical protein
MKALKSLLVGLVALLLCQVPVATAEATQEPVEIRILPVAALEDGSIVVRVAVRCQPVGEVLEALAFAQQDEAYAEGFFDQVTCDGRLRVEQLLFQPFDGAFDPGVVATSAFILILVDEETGETVQGDDFRFVRVVDSARSRSG